MEVRMTKYEIDVGEEFPLGARLAREFEARAHGFMGKVFVGALIFICLAAIAISHPVTMLAVLATLVVLGRVHYRHHHAYRPRHAHYDRYWSRGFFDEDFL
jgi:hypothetical protein